MATQGGGVVEEFRGGSYASAAAIVRRGEAAKVSWGPGRLRFDLMRLSPIYGDRPITSEMISRLREDLERALRLRFTKEMLTEAIMQIAHEDEFHPVSEYLERLKWDRTPRIAELPAALGADDSPLNRAMLRKFLVSGVARALQPGCKADSVLVLVGRQGAGKSRFLSALGGEWFADTAMQIGDKDALLVLHTAWLHEWPELDSYRRARDQNAVKAFLTSRADTFRAPYERAARQYPRRCVVAASTNDDQFLADVTGGRRYWVIKVGDRIAVEDVERDRDQLWAEAVVAYRAGEAWHLGEAEEAALSVVQVEHEVTDPWDEPIREICAGRSEITIREVLEALNFGVGQQGRPQEMRASDVLKRAGFQRRRVSRGTGRLWVYQRRAVEPALAVVRSLSRPGPACPDGVEEVGT
jgi:putative DNA primase/helicase